MEIEFSNGPKLLQSITSQFQEPLKETKITHHWGPKMVVVKVYLSTLLEIHDTGWARLIRSQSSARFSFEIGGIQINSIFLM